MPKQVASKRRDGAERRRLGVRTPVGEPLKIPWDFEVFLHDELGLRSGEGLHRMSSLEDWRKTLGRFFDAMAKGIRDSVSGDLRHKDGMIEHCIHAGERARTAKGHAELLAEATGDLARLSFLLLGRSALHRSGRQGGERSWALTRFRSLTYQRSAEQMVMLVLDTARYWRNDLVEEIPEYRDLLMRQLQGVHRGDHSSFLRWFRDTYPRQYAALF